MGEAEKRFKLACKLLVQQGHHPTPTKINAQVKRLGGVRRRRMNQLNGQEVKWLRDDLKVSPIRDCWRMVAMGPCKLLCCDPHFGTQLVVV